MDMIMALIIVVAVLAVLLIAYMVFRDRRPDPDDAVTDSYTGEVDPQPVDDGLYPIVGRSYSQPVRSPAEREFINRPTCVHDSQRQKAVHFSGDDVQDNTTYLTVSDDESPNLYTSPLAWQEPDPIPDYPADSVILIPDPKPTLSVPEPRYEPPVRVDPTPTPVYTTPELVSTPASTYTAPEPVFTPTPTPTPAYTAPEPAYTPAPTTYDSTPTYSSPPPVDSNQC